jgi:hypothetical protein
MAQPINNLVVISDLHCGCQLGLCPDIGAKLDNGGTYKPSRPQEKLFDLWRHFWDEWVPNATRGEPFALVVNGDALDGVHHRSVTQITHNLERQRDIAYEVIAPVAERAERLYMVRGTEAHVGQSGQDEEELARRLGAIRDEAGRHSRHELWIQIGQALVHCAHHIGTTGSMAYETSAVMKELAELMADASRWRVQPPDVVVRSHRHRHVQVQTPTANVYGIAFTTAAWQLRTPFAFKVPGGRVSTPHIGGSLIRSGDEEIYTRHFVQTISRSKTARPKVEV